MNLFSFILSGNQCCITATDCLPPRMLSNVNDLSNAVLFMQYYYMCIINTISIYNTKLLSIVIFSDTLFFKHLCGLQRHKVDINYGDVWC